MKQLSLKPAVLLLAFMLPLQTAHTTKSLTIIAHRGASYDAPENTLASAKLAWSQNADAVETDIRLTRDGKVIISHDDNVKRLTGTDARVADLTFAEARRLDVGRFKGQQFVGERMPTVEELIDTTPIGGQLFVHIKIGTEILPPLESAIHHAAMTGKYIVLISFDFDVLAQAHQRWPDCKTLWLVSYQHAGPSLEQLVMESKEAGLSGLDLSHEWPLDEIAVTHIRAAHLQLYAWTIDNPEDAQHWINLGVDGITTNRAGWIRDKIEL